jgi:hypothetical protein
MKTKKIIYAVIGFIVAFALMKQCEGEPKVVTNTVTKVTKVHDTITKVKIDTFYSRVYVNKYVDKQGEKVIVYVDKPNDSTITANQYDTELQSNNAKAKLQITTTGELLDVQGIITYPKEETTTTITKTRDASGLYLYGSAPIIAQALTPEIGLQFNIKNKMFISSGFQYNNLNNNLDVKVGIGVKLF